MATVETQIALLAKSIDEQFAGVKSQLADLSAKIQAPVAPQPEANFDPFAKLVTLPLDNWNPSEGSVRAFLPADAALRAWHGQNLDGVFLVDREKILLRRRDVYEFYKQRGPFVDPGFLYAVEPAGLALKICYGEVLASSPEHVIKAKLADCAGESFEAAFNREFQASLGTVPLPAPSGNF